MTARTQTLTLAVAAVLLLTVCTLGGGRVPGAAGWIPDGSRPESGGPGPARVARVAREARDERGYAARPDQPDAAEEFRRLQMRDENGIIPADGLRRAAEHVSAMRARQEEALRSRFGVESLAQPPRVAGLDPSQWTWLGPGNVGGRIRSILIDPNDATRMWVGSVSGGIWRSTDAGVTWAPVDDFMANLGVSAMAMDPTNPATMYAGTGEGVFGAPLHFTDSSGVLGGGLFKSTDAGLTWTLLPGTDPGADPVPGCGPGFTPCPGTWSAINRLAISPDGGTILAATNGGIVRSADGGATWIQTWSSRTLDVDFRPDNSGEAVAGGRGKAWRSIDSGQSWTGLQFDRTITATATGNDGRIELAYAAGSPQVLFALVDNNNGDLYRSADGGQTTLARVNTGTNFFLLGGAAGGSTGWYNNIVWVNPLDPTFVIVGGIDLWRSVDSGTTFTRISDWSCGPLNAANDDCPGLVSAHADHHVIVADPGFDNTTNRKVYFGNDGGLYRADDVAGVQQQSGWVNLNHGLGVTQFYAGAASGDTIIGGAQDNSTLRFTGDTQAWSAVFGGDGGGCAADPADANYLYGEYPRLQIFRSTDGGASASYIYCNPVPSGGACTGAGTSGINDTAGANWVAPIVLDPSDPNTMLAGSLSLWRSGDVKSATPTWTPIKCPVPDASGNSNPVSAIAISRVNPGLVVVGYNDGRIEYTIDALTSAPACDTGPTWDQIDAKDANNRPVKRMVTRLAIDDTHIPAWIYATFGGFSPDNVYVTRDLGVSWNDVSGVTGSGTDLPSVPVRTLVINPVRPQFLYVGTEVGLFASEDAGATWQIPQGGPANVSVDDLFWSRGDLIAATHGRGMYTTHTPVFATPICAAPSAGCSCAGYWDCACGWPGDQVPQSTDDVRISCPITVRSLGNANAANLAVDARITLQGGGIAAQGDVINNGAIARAAGSSGYVTCNNLVNLRPAHVVSTNGVIDTGGSILARGDVLDGGIMSCTSLECENLTVAASDGFQGGDASLTTTGQVLAHQGIFNNGTINAGAGISLANGNGGKLHMLKGTGTWQAPSLAVGVSFGTDTAVLANDLTLGVASTSVSANATLNLAGFALAINGTSLASQGTIDLGPGTLTLNGMTSMSLVKALGAGTVRANPGAAATLLAGNGQAGTFQPSLRVLSGPIAMSNATVDGTLTIDPGVSLLLNSGLVQNGNLVVNGTLGKSSGGSTTTLYFNGPTLANNGSLLADFVTFVDYANPTNHHPQAIGGPGAWPAGLTFQLSNGAVTTLLSDLTIAHDQMTIGRGSTIDLQNFRLTYAGNNLNNGGTVTGGGAFVMAPADGTAGIVGGGLGSDFAAEFRIASGIVTITDRNVPDSGSMFVDAGATLALSGLGSLSPTGSVTIDGTFNGNGSALYLLGNSTFTNNGAVQSTFLNFGNGFGGPRTQRLAGAGAWPGATGRLFIGAESSTTLTSDVTYDGPLLYVDGRLDTGPYTLTVPCGVPWQGAGEVFGNLRRTNLAACAGAVAFGSPYTTIQVTSGTPPTSITVSVQPGSPAGFPGAVARTYTITPTPATGFTATVRLHYLDSELNGNDEATLQLYRNDGTSWNAQGATARDTTSNWVEYAGVTQFSPWTIASPPPLFVTYDSRTSFNTALGTAVPTTVGFEGIAPAGGRFTVPQGSTLTLSGVQFGSPDGNVVIADAGYASAYDLGSGASLSPQNAGNGYTPATVDVTPPADTHAVGFDFRTFNSAAQIDILVTTSAGAQRISFGQLSTAVQFVGFTSPHVIQALEVKALGGQYVALDNLTFAATPGGCVAPGLAILIENARPVAGTGQLVLDFQDPNPATLVTGYDVYRSASAALPPAGWTRVGRNVVDADPAAPDMQWIDASGGTPPVGGAFFYRVAAYDSLCDLEGPL